MKIKAEIIQHFKNGQFSMNDYMSVKKYFFETDYHSDLTKNARINWEDKIRDDIRRMDFEPILDKIHHKIRSQENMSTKTVKKFYYSFLKVAALLLLPAFITIATLSYFLSTNTATTKIDNIKSWAEIHSPVGAKTHFVLPDGSEGWLNSMSSIKYHVSFEKNREIELKGEAWFNVKHDNGKRFVVKTNNFNVNVLGTRFNVLAYDNDETSEVILEKGSVLVTGKKNGFSKNLKPDQQLIYNSVNKNLTINRVDAESYTAWKDGQLIFKDQPMLKLAERLGRNYNADIILHGQELKELVFRAKFENESLEEILKLISISEPIKYRIHKRYKQADDSYSKTKVEIWLNNKSN